MPTCRRPRSIQFTPASAPRRIMLDRETATIATVDIVRPILVAMIATFMDVVDTGTSVKRL